jgi:hypothetical protein
MMNHHQVHCLHIHKNKCLYRTLQLSFQYKHKYNLETYGYLRVEYKKYKWMQLIMLPINVHITLKSAFTTEKRRPHLLKKSNHFLPSQLNGDVFCWTSSSCESSGLTSMMESPLPFLPNSLSNCFLCCG